MDKKEIFWKWFLILVKSMGREEGMLRAKRGKILEKMDYYLDAYCPGLGYLYESANLGSSFSRFTVYGYGDMSKLVQVQALVRKAPHIEGVRYFSGFPETLDFSDLENGTDAPFVFDDFSIKASEILCETVGRDEVTGKLHVVFHVLNLPEDYDAQLYYDNIHVVLLHALGEIDLYQCVSCFDFVRLTSDCDGLLNLYDLPCYFSTLADGEF